MRFLETPLRGAFVIDPERIADERGFFARVFCRRAFQEHGLKPDLVQCNISFNPRKGTLRGMHFQMPPRAEVKLVRCTAGAIYDVIIDLRRGSPTFKQWFAQDLTCDNRLSLYIPEGFAHGYQTLVDDTEVFYQHSEFYSPDDARGVRFDDPAFNIAWPLPVDVISSRDRRYPLLDKTFGGIDG